MNLEDYRKHRARLTEDSPKYRDRCVTCVQPDFGCYCRDLRPFDAKMKFVILIHPIEARRRIATGRMSHLCLRDSELIQGQDYSANVRVNALLADPRFAPMVLYPGPTSLNLSLDRSSNRSPSDRDQLHATAAKTPLIFVIDGTWATAKKTMRTSQNLMTLPRICFTPDRPSRFRVRKQPGVECYSTIEAIHQTIELLGPSHGFDPSTGAHHALLHVFDAVVERQLDFLRRSYLSPRSTAYRRLLDAREPEYLKGLLEEPG